MQPLSILGTGADDLADRLVDRLAERTDDGVVQVDAAADTNDDGAVDALTARSRADTAVRLDEDGTWTAAGTDADLTALLDRFAPTHDYLIVTGRTRLRVPTVLVDDDRTPEDVAGTVVHELEDPAAVDIDDLINVIDAAEPWITLEELIARVKEGEGADRSGAIATFTGRVRARDAPEDDRTTHLAFERYEGVAADRMDAIATELEAREGVFDVRMHHRTGVIPDGEDIVFVVVLAGHRDEAFRTVKDGIDRLKEWVPIFKKETTEREEFWVHER
ncbi:molybdopterin synthase [Halopenitus sp. H-Gu1]|uniref:molybdopterin synthase n=1 Tax=Halopenitus sp. H-Gu1 TaxID=3242697 RepID=UPI00359E3E24